MCGYTHRPRLCVEHKQLALQQLDVTAISATVQDPLAITYHDRSPLENMHAATLTRLMLQPSLNFFSHLSSDLFKSVRKYAEDAILHTDPADHVMHMDAWALHIPAWRQHMVMVSTGEGSSDTSQTGNSKRRV